MSKPADVDEMVSRFLSELDALSDSLGVSGTQDLPQQEPEPPAQYRNIDVLLMSDTGSAHRRSQDRTIGEKSQVHVSRKEPRLASLIGSLRDRHQKKKQN